MGKSIRRFGGWCVIFHAVRHECEKKIDDYVIINVFAEEASCAGICCLSSAHVTIRLRLEFDNVHDCDDFTPQQRIANTTDISIE